MSTDENREMVDLPLDGSLWERFFSVFPIVLVATVEEHGGHDIAPKHLAMPMSWESWFGFVCTPRHRTYHNAKASGSFTVSYPRPDHIVMTSMAAAPRSEDSSKPSLSAVPVRPARRVPGVVVDGCPVVLECELHQVVEGLGENSLLIGKIVAAEADEAVLREMDVDDADLVHSHPLLAYLYPGRFAVVGDSRAFPFHSGFCR